MNYKAIIPAAMLVLGGTSLSQAQDNAPVDQEKSEIKAECKCLGNRSATVNVVYPYGDNQMAIIKHNTIAGGITYIPNGKETSIGGIKTGYKALTKTDKKNNEKFRVDNEHDDAEIRAIATTLRDEADKICGGTKTPKGWPEITLNETAKDSVKTYFEKKLKL